MQLRTFAALLERHCEVLAPLLAAAGAAAARVTRAARKGGDDGLCGRCEGEWQLATMRCVTATTAPATAAGGADRRGGADDSAGGGRRHGRCQRPPPAPPVLEARVSLAYTASGQLRFGRGAERRPRCLIRSPSASSAERTQHSGRGPCWLRKG